MDDSYLFYLFNQYLGRNPTPEEIERHGHKLFGLMEDQISNCEERKQYLEKIKLFPELSQRKNPYPHPDEKIKIALLISGHIRSNSILHNLKRYSELYDIDVFIFTWDTVGLKGKEMNLEDTPDSSSIKKIIESIPNVRKFQIKNNKQYIESIQEETSKIPYFNFSSPEVFIKSQLYSIHRSYELMEEYCKENDVSYDLVLKTRFDLKLIEFDVTPKLVAELNTNDIIFVPNSDVGHNHPDYGTSCMTCDLLYYERKFKSVHIFDHTSIICDLFAYGSQKSMKDYCSLYLNYDNFAKMYFDLNLKFLKKNPNIKYTMSGSAYNIQMDMEQHMNTLYYLYCSYPERMLQKQLKDYMLVKSTNIKMLFVR